MKPVDPRQVLLVADCIRSYLAARPNAMETAEGIADWWLERRSGMDLHRLTRRALQRLEREGSVERISSHAGRVLYRAPRSS